MPNDGIVRMDARGAMIVPAKYRKRLGVHGEGLWMIEEKDGRLILRPAVAVAVEKYTPERIAEFLLNNAIDAEDYKNAVAKVRSMGLNPAKIPHDKPT
jgi:AbrB family looped-hinge helix DNA binding protein